MTETPSGYYGAAVWNYHDAGWQSILPLPPGQKFPPPEGYTGAGGAVPSYADLYAWADTRGDWNLGLRMPPTVIGLDVDAYGGKPGAETLAELTAQLGPLPGTWQSSSRGDGLSGISLFTVPDGTVLVSALPGIELIQSHHRYAVAWPSVHPTTGRAYEWVRTDTGEVGGVPVLAELPALPPAWVEHLTAGKSPSVKIPGTDAEAVLAGFPRGEPCHHVRKAAGLAMAEGSRHDAYNQAVLAVTRAGRNGCPGAAETLGRLAVAFVAEIADRASEQGAAGEIGRSIEGACSIVVNEPQGGGCSDDLDWIPSELPDDLADDWDRLVEAQARRLDLMEQARARHRARSAEKARPLEVATATELLAADDVDTAWRVPYLWQSDGRVLLVAAAKTGKTTLVVRNLLPCLVDGGSFLGAYPVEADRDRKVLYLNMEVGTATLRGWLETSGIVATDQVLVASLRGRSGALDISTDEGRARFSDFLRAQNVGTVILDPLAPLLAALGLEENSNADVARFFSWWSDALGAGGVDRDLIAHHAGHDGGRSRGASRLLDEPDAVWTMTRKEIDGPDGAQDFRLLRAMGRDVDLEESVLTFDRVSGRLTLRPESPGEVLAEANRIAQEAQIRTALDLAGPNGLTRQALFRECPAGTSQATERALEGMIRRGAVIALDANQGTVYRLGGHE